MTQEIDIAALRKAAQEATPGPWKVVGKNTDGVIIETEAYVPKDLRGFVYSNHEIISSSEWTYVEDNNAQYIASANPAVILTLLDRLEQAEKDAARYRTISRDREGYPIEGPERVGYFQISQKRRDGEAHYLFGEHLDAAADAAMQGEGA